MIKKMKILRSIYHYLWAIAAAVVFGFPAKKMFVLGITGTKGKTTSVYLIHHILESAGRKAAMLSTAEIKIGKETEKNLTGNTMPGRFFIQRFLKEALRTGCRYAIMEVTSQGVLQHRHQFIKWGAAAFTNLKPEHIEAHGGFENYREAKLKFFRYAKKNREAFFLINKEDENAEYFIKEAEGKKVVLYSPSDAEEKKLAARMLPGKINEANIALAAAFAKEIGLSEEEIKKGIESFPGAPGRMEFVKREPFTVVIDYAYTPDSLEPVYEELKKYLKGPENKIITVFGAAGGGRDKWKRPTLGKIAAEFCKEIILTTEEPYDEKPEDIMEDINGGIPKGKNVYKIIDRKEAIEKAMELAQEGDVIALLGKGAEPYIHSNGKKISWNEKEAAEEAIKKIIR
ncbi:MAG: Mur ligase family protein [Patescibacteria group bacterium]